MTRREKQLCDFIADYQAKQGIAPSYDEMRAGLNLKSKSGIHRLVSQLEEKCLLRRIPNRARTIVLRGEAVGKLTDGEVIIALRGCNNKFAEEIIYAAEMGNIPLVNYVSKLAVLRWATR